MWVGLTFVRLTAGTYGWVSYDCAGPVRGVEGRAAGNLANELFVGGAIRHLVEVAGTLTDAD
jgi:hypothetical protein